MARSGALLTEARPLLAFDAPNPGRIPVGEDKPRYKPGLQTPSHKKQGARLTPQFSTLLQALNARRTIVDNATSESNPELVVVFDLAGSVQNFMRAIKGINGLEFLAEFDEEPTDADEEFFYHDKDGVKSETTVPETLYMVMTNARAAEELIRLFGKWKRNKRVKFPKGLAPLKQAFAMMRAVRRWGPEDRVRETRLLESWNEDVATAGGQGFARVEIELWFRENPTVRATLQNEMMNAISSTGGRIISSAIVEDIDYHALLAEIPYDQVKLVLENGLESIQLLATESVMFVSPARPMTVPSPLSGEPFEFGEEFSPPSQVPPRVALLDGVPLANHAALAGRLILDDPDDRASRYTVGRQIHGTAMASLISHGDLGIQGPALSTQIYVRPIMEPHEFFDSEIIAKDELLVDLVHRAFLRMFKKDESHSPAAPSVRIVNLSIGDPVRIFGRRLSPLAKLLDWLAHTYNLVILVSAGNHDTNPSIDASIIDDKIKLRSAVLRSNYESIRNRRIYSPAEAVNVITVGAVHADSSTNSLPDTVLDATEIGMPATYSAVGYGYRRAIKPEILLPGGRQIYQRPPSDKTGEVTLSTIQTFALGPGLLVAAPNSSKLMGGVAHSSGTSNATALGTRATNFIFDVLEGLSNGAEDFPFPNPQYHPVLAKTLLVHAASWGSIPNYLRTALPLNPSNPRRDITQVLGYGPVDLERVASASRTRAVLLGAGSIGATERHTFTFPLPESLRAKTEWRRLTITLAWLSPINARSQKHRMARLRFKPPVDQLGVIRTEADSNAVLNGTVQHEILEGTAAAVFEQNGVLTINVDCRIDAGKLTSPVRYGLAVSLEMSTNIRADIHAEVRQLLQNQLRSRISERTRL